MRVNRFVVAVAVMSIAVLSGCRGGSDDKAEPTPTTSAPATAATKAPKSLSTDGRECSELEEPLRLYPGHPLSMANRGHHLEQVQELQSMINGAGDGSTCIPEDGDFGPVTREAVKKFQGGNNLVVDGLVGEQTWNQLNLLLSH